MSHWAPVGLLSRHYIGKPYERLRVSGIEPKEEDPLISNLCCQNQLNTISGNAFLMKIAQILERASIRGPERGESMRAGSVKHPQGFPKFGRIAMQNAGSPDEAIEHFM